MQELLEPIFVNIYGPLIGKKLIIGGTGTRIVDLGKNAIVVRIKGYQRRKALEISKDPKNLKKDSDFIRDHTWLLTLTLNTGEDTIIRK